MDRRRGKSKPTLDWSIHSKAREGYWWESCSYRTHSCLKALEDKLSKWKPARNLTANFPREDPIKPLLGRTETQSSNTSPGRVRSIFSIGEEYCLHLKSRPNFTEVILCLCSARPGWSLNTEDKVAEIAGNIFDLPKGFYQIVYCDTSSVASPGWV